MTRLQDAIQLQESIHQAFEEQWERKAVAGDTIAITEDGKARGYCYLPVDSANRWVEINEQRSWEDRIAAVQSEIEHEINVKSKLPYDVDRGAVMGLRLALEILKGHCTS